MSGENESGQEKTEQPSEKRLRDAREDGQIPRSRELATASIFGAALLVIYSLGDTMAASSLRWMQGALDLSPAWQKPEIELPMRAAILFSQLVIVVAPLILACLLACVVAPMLLGGVNLSAKALTPNPSHLDPFKGLARMYGRDAIAEFLRSLLRVALIGGMALLSIQLALTALLALVHLPLETGVSDGLGIVLGCMRNMGIGLLLLAAIDAPYQRWSHRQKMMMSRQELLQEHKESEGNPEVKGRLRRMQQEIAEGRMMEAVPKADMILVNPTHYAVALSYQPEKMRAPQVVAKGADHIAATIRALAEAHGVPIVSAPPLARALYRQVGIGKEIPVALYSVVAEVLGYIYQLRRANRDGPPPEMPEIIMPYEEP